MAVAVARHAADFDCTRCKWNRHCDDTNPAPFDQWTIEGVGDMRTCPKPAITDRSRLLLDLYSHYKSGVLLESPQYRGNPRAYMVAMKLIDHYANKVDS